jgi:hypothetical protein
LFAGLCLYGSFTNPAMLIGVAVFGAYTYHLYSGGREFLRECRDGTSRSIAWVYWAAITAGAIALGFRQPSAWLVALGTGAYTIYLFRGGRWILWIW